MQPADSSLNYFGFLGVLRDRFLLSIDFENFVINVSRDVSVVVERFKH